MREDTIKIVAIPSCDPFVCERLCFLICHYELSEGQLLRSGPFDSNEQTFDGMIGESHSCQCRHPGSPNVSYGKKFSITDPDETRGEFGIGINQRYKRRHLLAVRYCVVGHEQAARP